MSVWQDKFINVNKYARSGKKLTDVRKIVMHYTANPGASAENHYKYFSSLSGRYASAHFFIDSKDALCIIPLSEVAYHANDVQQRDSKGNAYRGVAEIKPNANLLSIGIELCIEKDGTFHAETIRKAEEVAAELCKRYKLDPLTDIVRHYDVTHKNCPAPWVSNSAAFTAFKAAVKNKLVPGSETIVKAPAEKVESVIIEKPKSTGDSGMKSIQVTLNTRYAAGLAVDGLYGPATKKALVKGLQTELNKQYGAKLAVDGIFGSGTASAVVNVSQGARGNITWILQAALYALGYDTKGVDGVFGSGTTKAVKAFQKNSGLAADGIAGKSTFTKLF
ncbi:peptidoglycan recognition protein family protein [Priestia flexa]|uniref:peptidoglycan recognition protein family protein n=1 Tax=Priestia flexa TaxID=86664 RepID=UPI003F83AC67